MPEISWQQWREAALEREADVQRADTTAARMDEHIARKCREEIARHGKHKTKPVRQAPLWLK